MQFADLSSLLQLSVGLNLGVGAVAFFYESIGARTERAISVVDQHLIRIIKDYNHDRRFVNKIFEICKAYSQLTSGLGVLKLEHAVWDRLFSKFVFVAGSLLAFLGLVIVSIAPSESSGYYVILVIAVVTNLPPLFFATFVFVIAARHELEIAPLLQEVQEMIFENFVRAPPDAPPKKSNQAVDVHGSAG